MKNILLVFCSLFFLNLNVIAADESREPEAASEGICQVCQVQATKKCSLCKIIYYCGKEHQKQDWPAHKSNCPGLKKVPEKNSDIPAWVSAKLKQYIEFCQQHPTLASDGNFMNFNLIEAHGLDKEIVEIIQVALQNKPFSYSIEMPSDALLFKMAEGRAQKFPEERKDDKLWNEAIKFAEERGVNIVRYTEGFFSTVMIAFQEKFRNRALYFIDHRENPKQEGGGLKRVILNGLLLNFTPENIRLYCTAQFRLPQGNEQSEKQYQSALAQAISEMESIVKGN